MTVVQLVTDNREPFRQYDRPQPWFGAAPAALLQGFSECPDVRVHVVSCSQRPMRSSPEKLADNIWFHSLHVPKWGWLRSGYLGCIRATRSKIEAIKPDIVHGQGTERNSAISAAFSGFPNVVTIHGNMDALASLFKAWPGSYYWLVARLEGFTLRWTDGVFCNSGYTESLVQPRAQRVWRVANAIRKEFFVELPSRRPAEPATILNVGVISPRKRQIELLQCARQLHERGVNVSWNFYGEVDAASEYAARFLAEAQEAESVGYARYAGILSSSEIVPCFDRASALVHFPTEEAFGLVVAEALSRNLKFFGTRVGGIADIAGGVEGAELFDMEDNNALIDAIEHWVRKGAPLLEGSAEKMRRRYHPHVIAKRHAEIYRELLDRS